MWKLILIAAVFFPAFFWRGVLFALTVCGLLGVALYFVVKHDEKLHAELRHRAEAAGNRYLANVQVVPDQFGLHLQNTSTNHIVYVSLSCEWFLKNGQSAGYSEFEPPGGLKRDGWTELWEAWEAATIPPRSEMWVQSIPDPKLPYAADDLDKPRCQVKHVLAEKRMPPNPEIEVTPIVKLYRENYSNDELVGVTALVVKNGSKTPVNKLRIGCIYQNFTQGGDFSTKEIKDVRAEYSRTDEPVLAGNSSSSFPLKYPIQLGDSENPKMSINVRCYATEVG